MVKGKRIVLKHPAPDGYLDQNASIQYEKWMREHVKEGAALAREKMNARRKQCFKFLGCMKEE